MDKHGIPKRDWRGKRVKKMKGVSPEYQSLVFTHNLSNEKMLEADTTDTLRAASKNGYARRCLDKYMGLRPLPLKSEFSLYPHQIQTLLWLRDRENAIHYGIKGGIVALEMGLGKCFSRHTPILMWDGTVKMVQDVKEGDLVCGDDSTPRKVLSTCSGQEQMYRISPTKGDSYVVNESHILSLFISGNKGISYVNGLKQYQVSWFNHETRTFCTKVLGNDNEKAIEQVNRINSSDHIDIKLVDYLKLNITTKKRLKGYRAGVEWPRQEVAIEPYILGVWLGDGWSRSPTITNIDDEILDEIFEWCDRCGYRMTQHKKKVNYGITGGFGKVLEKEGLIKNKHVPLKYKRNDMETRLELLAGLIDTDGSLIGGCYEIIQKRKGLAEDICFLARSVGLAAYFSQCEKYCTYKGEKRVGTYYRSTISGDIDRIPVKVLRKQAKPRKQRKSVLVTQIKVEKMGVDDYFGFTLDGNSRYLLGDFTVTHNSLIAMAYTLISPRPSCKEKHGEKGFPTLVVCSKTVMQNWMLEKKKFFGHRVNVLFFHRMYMGNAVKNVTREFIVEFDLVVTTYDVVSGICKKKDYHESVLERGDDSSLQKGKVIAINCRRRWQSNYPSTVGEGILYCTPWERVICDESHIFANPTTATYKYIMALYGKYKICLSGTPVQNYETDIWSQMRFCGYIGVDTALDWKRKWEEKMEKHQLHTAILEMSYKDAGIKLPDLHHYKMEIKLGREEKECYDFVMNKAKKVYVSMTQDLTSFSNVLVLFLRLRQCCIAPYLMTRESKRMKGGTMGRADANKNKQEVKLMKELYKGSLGVWLHDKKGTAGMRSAKIQAIIKKIKNIRGKVLIFSTFVSALDLLAAACDKYLPDFKYIQVDGGTVGKERQVAFDRFREKKKIRGLFMTYKVGSQGITLTEATHVIPIEPWWNDSVPNQAIHRAWRLGQENDVEVHNILVQDSIECKMREICEGKDKMSKSIMEGSAHKMTRMDKFTLGKMLEIYK